jgi:signal transduction histidine kinase
MDQADETVLCNLAALDRRDLSAALRDVTRAAARVLNVRRVGFWTFRRQDELHCEVLFDAVDRAFRQGDSLRAADIPRYFEALRCEQLIIADNARQDPRTRELVPKYLGPLDIRSMLDVPVWVCGELSGVLCHEQVGTQRDWSHGETSFALAAANAIAAALEARARIHAEADADRERFLSQATALLFEDLNIDAIPRKLARLAVPYVADWCLLGGLDRRRLELVAYGHPDVTDPERLRELRDLFFPLDLHSVSPAVRVLHTGRPLVVPVLDDNSLRRFVDNSRQLAAVRSMHIGSLLALPLLTKSGPLGSLLFLSSRPRYHDPGVVALCEQLAARATLALCNARLYRQAQDAVRQRDEFLSVASHELNTPIASLQLSLEGVESGDLAGQEKLERVLPVVLRQVRRLNRLVRDLLDVSRIETGQLQIHRVPVDLQLVVDDVATQMGPELERARCALTVEVDPGPLDQLHGNWDRTYLEQVVSNLLGNALKFGAGQPIVIRLGSLGGTAFLEVRDRGVGIAPDRARSIFQRFERAVSPRAYGGLGLGLYIVSALVAAHGGSVRVQSELGEGACFRVELPRSIGVAPPPRQPLSPDQVVQP